MKEIVHLRITSYRGSIGAEHYYGTFQVRTKYTRIVREDGSEGLVSRSGYGVVPHPCDRHELTRVIDSKEARYLNKKDDDGFPNPFPLKRGDKVTRFNDKPSIIEAAKVEFPLVFDADDVLLYEEDRYSGDAQFLSGPDEVQAIIEGPRNDREDALIALGYLILSET
jgi:hypothetical protein